MTPLKPLENLRVKGVASERYPSNVVCAHPECAEPANEQHHCFPRSQIGNDSWFVQIEEAPGNRFYPNPVPHVTGLCNFHHGIVEMHMAWIKLEDAGFVWYDREPAPDHLGGEESNDGWRKLGPLNPQPGSQEGKTKRRKRKQGEERRKRKIISVRVPDDTEDGGAVWDLTLELVKERLVIMGLYAANDLPPAYEAIIAALTDWLNTEMYE